MNTGNRAWLGGAAACLALAFLSPLVTADIYKTTDEDGNVIFTDQPPPEGGDPVDLPELDTVETEAPKPLPGRNDRGQRVDAQGQPETTNSDLRSMYQDFRITSPQPEENLWGTGQEATVSWTAGQPLRDGMDVVVSLNGEEQQTTTASSVTLTNLVRGEHTVSARLRNARGQTIAEAEPVTFYVKQNSRLYNRPAASPAGGGG